jgi:hypothetical protein
MPTERELLAMAEPWRPYVSPSGRTSRRMPEALAEQSRPAPEHAGFIAQPDVAASLILEAIAA